MMPPRHPFAQSLGGNAEEFDKLKLRRYPVDAASSIWPIEAQNKRLSMKLKKRRLERRDKFWTPMGDYAHMPAKPTPISAKLGRIAAEYVSNDSPEDVFRFHVSLAAIAWNLTIFPAEERSARWKEYEGWLSEYYLATEVQDMLHEIKEMAEMKQGLFPEDERYIVGIQVAREDGKYRLACVSSTDWPFQATLH